MAINGFRVASFSCFACRPALGRLVPDPELLGQISQIAREIASGYKPLDCLLWDENPRCGILILHSHLTEKRNGVAALIDRLAPEQTVMISDSMSDFLNIPEVTQFAVANADPKYKEKATYVATQSLASGVIECLQQL